MGGNVEKKKAQHRRSEIDKERKGGGSPLRGNRKSKSTLLDEIDDPHGDYVRAGAAGYDRSPEYPWTWEDVRKHEAQVKRLESGNANPERAS